MMVIVYYCDDKNMFLGQLVCVQKPKQKSSKLITNCTNKEIPKNTEQFPTNQWMKIWGLTLPKKYRYPRILQKYRTGIKFHIPLIKLEWISMFLDGSGFNPRWQNRIKHDPKQKWLCFPLLHPSCPHHLLPHSTTPSFVLQIWLQTVVFWSAM